MQRRRPPQNQSAPEELAAQLRLDELKLFNLVAKLGSFSAAAKQLGITQPTASRRIRRLEESLNLRLFERTTHTVTLTELGAQFLQHSLQLMANFDSTLNFVQQTREEPAGLLTIGLPQWLLQTIDSRFFAEFLQKHPKIQLNFYNLSPVRLLVESADCADMDLMLHFFIPAERKMTARPIKQYTIDFFASRNYLATAPSLVHPHQFSQHACLHVRNPFLQDKEWLWTEHGQSKSVIINAVSTFETFTTALDWAQQDIGVIWCFDALIDKAEHSHQMKRLFDGAYGTNFTLNAIYPSRRLLSPKVNVFVDELTQFLQKQ
ncbi:LysR family transcriptional regulator [Pseudomonadota bacterium]